MYVLWQDPRNMQIFPKRLISISIWNVELDLKQPDGPKERMRIQDLKGESFTQRFKYLSRQLTSEKGSFVGLFVHDMSPWHEDTTPVI